MLADARIGANVPVSDLRQAIAFFENGVATMRETRAAWLKDQDGNILEIVGA